jgi:hypothetical protein
LCFLQAQFYWEVLRFVKWKWPFCGLVRPKISRQQSQLALAVHLCLQTLSQEANMSHGLLISIHKKTNFENKLLKLNHLFVSTFGTGNFASKADNNFSEN